MNTQGSHQILTEDITLGNLQASDIEIIVGSDDSKAKGGGTLKVLFKQHESAEWSTVKTFSTDDIIEDFKANSTHGGNYRIVLEGANAPSLQVSWKI